MSKINELFNSKLNVINVGVESFKDDMLEQTQTIVGSPSVGRGSYAKSQNLKKERELLAEGETEFKFNISQNSRARIVFTGEVTQEAIELLAEMLNIQKRTFPKEADLKTSPNEAGNSEELTE